MPISQLQEQVQGLNLTEKQLRFMQEAPNLAPGTHVPETKPVQDLTTSGAIRQHRLQQQAEGLEEFRSVRDQSYLTELGNALQTTGTAHLIRQGLNWLERTEEADPNFKLTVQEVEEYAREFDLVLDDHLMKRLSKAESREHAYQIVRDQHEMDRVQRTLVNAGVTSFAVHALDPTEWALAAAAAAATGPGGLAVRGARFAQATGTSLRTARNTGRAVHGVGQTAAVVGGTAAFEQAGMDITLADYVLGAALPFFAGMALTPTRAIDAAIGYNKAAARRLEAPRTSAGAADAAADAAGATPGARRADAPKAEAPTYRTAREFLEAKAPTYFQAAKNALERARELPPTQEILNRFQSLRKRLSELQEATTVVSRAVGTVTDYQAPAGAVSESGRKLTRAERRELAKEARKAARKEPRLEAEAESRGTTAEALAAETESVRTELDQLRRDLDVAETADDVRREMQELTSSGTLPRSVSELLDEADLAEYQRLLERQEAPTQGTVGQAEAVSGQPAPEAAAAVPTGANLRGERLRQVSQTFNAFVSEFDKITGGLKSVRDFVGRVIDDPLGRFPDKATAASQLRINQNLANAERLQYERAIQDYTLQRIGKTWRQTRWGYSTEYLNAKLEVERNLYDISAQRDWLKQTGLSDAQIDASMVGVDPETLRLVHAYEDVFNKSAQRAHEQGLLGFETEYGSAGYVPRRWVYASIQSLDRRYGEGTSVEIIQQAVQKSNPEMTSAETAAIAKAVVARSRETATGARSEFMGQLGKVETSNIVELLEIGGTDPDIVESIKRRLNQQVTESGAVSYGKPRIPMDMRTTMVMPDGTEVKLTDLLDTNVSALMESYQNSMAGRSALASVGIGDGTQGVATYIQAYRTLLDSEGIPPGKADSMQRQLESLMADFTGIKPDSNILSPVQRSLMDLASATLLSGSGLWQVVETGVILANKGASNSLRYMFKNVPGLRPLLKHLGNSSDLHDELKFVTGLDFALDPRMKPFLRQSEINIGAYTNWQKYTSMSREFSSTLNGMRWVHGMQARMLTNLNMHDMWKAANGDARALREVTLNGASERLLDAVRRVSVVENGSLKGAGLEGLTHAEMQEYMHVLTRMQDSSLLINRAGWGSSFGRSAVGQFLGQFTSYVTMAHNRILRGTYHDRGAMGVAAVLAHTLPFSAISYYLNEARKGNVIDLDSEEGLQELAIGALSYSSVGGVFSEVVSVVSGKNSSRGAAAFNILQAPGQVTSAIGDLAEKDWGGAAAGAAKATAAITPMGAFPGAITLIRALEE